MPQSLYNIRRRQVLQLLAGASGAALLHACNSSSSPEAATPDSAATTTSESGSTSGMSLSLGTAPWVGQVPLYIAQEKGFFAEEGLDFELRNFGDSGGYLSAFLANKLDSLSLVSAEAVTLLDQGKDYKVVLIQDNSVGGDGILAKDSITSIADFKGKKVAVDTSGVSYFFLLQVLKEAGLTKDDITAINTEPSAAASAFQTGNVDIAVTYAPYLQQAADATADGRIIYDSSKMPTAIIDMYIFDSAYVEKNPAAVQAFVNGIFKGMEFLKDNPEEALKISAVALDVGPADVESDLKGVKLPDKATNLQMMAEPDSDLYVVEPLQELSDFLLSEGQIETEKGDFADILDPQFVEASPS
ncbi:MAG: ABC transporter substrate-binding protein [Phormidesmis sp.]